MNSCKSQAAAAFLVILAGGFAAVPAHATNDTKTIAPTHCQPYGPGTTISELVYSQTGVYNPGTTNETVICEMPVDADSSWSSTPSLGTSVDVWFRAGSVSGKVACTAYTGSTAVIAGTTYSVANNPAGIAAGTRGHYTLQLAESSGLYGSAPPTNVLCTLTPKATLGTFFLFENIATNTP